MIIGRVRKPHGVRGEMKVSILSDLPERFLWLKRVFVSRRAEDAAPKEIAIESVRLHQTDALVKFVGYDGREAAGVLRQHYVFVPVEEAIPLEEDEYYAFEIVGVEVFLEDGTALGEVINLIETGANDVFVVEGDRGELLIPDIDEVVVSLDIEAGKMVIRPIPGLLPE